MRWILKKREKAFSRRSFGAMHLRMTSKTPVRGFLVRQSGWLALGICLKLLLAGILGMGSVYLVKDQINMRMAIPDLQLSAVYHGDQMRWCYDFSESLNGVGTDNKPSEPGGQFSNFVKTQLSKYTTQISYLKSENQVHVTWQATPHNQCQFVFTAERGGSKVKIERRKFSLHATLRGSAHNYKVKDNLEASHVGTDRPQALEDLGFVHDLTFAQLLTALGIDVAGPATTLNRQQIAFIRGIFTPPPEETPSTGTAVPTSSPNPMNQRMGQWMYGSSTDTPALQNAAAERTREMYYQRRD